MSYQGPGVYRHYKGGTYEVLGLGVREETVIKPGEDPLGDAFREGAGETPSPVIVVIYKPLSPGSLLGRGMFHDIDFWERTLEDFNNDVVLDHHPASVTVPRFTYIRSHDERPA